MADDMRSILSVLPPASLAAFLSLEDEGDSSSDEELGPGTVLLETIAEALPVDPESLQKQWPRGGVSCLPLNRTSLGDLLTTPDAPLESLRHCKDQMKEKAAQAMTRTETIVYTVIYYAAIAAAVRHYRVRITSFTAADLKAAFECWASKSWMAPELRASFIAAGSLLEEVAT